MQSPPKLILTCPDSPPCGRETRRHQLEPPAAERAHRALCTLFCAGTSTRRALQYKVSRSHRICPACQLTCSRTHASAALARRHRSTLGLPPPRPPPPRRSPRGSYRRAEAGRTAGARGSPHDAGCCGLRVCVCVRGPQAYRDRRSRGVRSSYRAAARRVGSRSVASCCAEGGRGEGRCESNAGPSVYACRGAVPCGDRCCIAAGPGVRLQCLVLYLCYV